MESHVVVGVDIGQKVDPTAIVVLEAVSETLHPGVVSSGGVTYWPAPKARMSYTARTLQRLPLGTPYPEVASTIADVVTALHARGVERPLLLVDATGVGLPIVDLVREALKGLRHRHRLFACLFTHGDRYTIDTSDYRAPQITVGKAYLVSRLQALLQTGRITLPETHEARVLARELQDYEIRVDENANDKFGAFKVGTHDDLVTALGLAALDEPRKFLPAQMVIHR